MTMSTYLLTTTSPEALGAVPDDRDERSHHVVKHGKTVGYRNVHPSWNDLSTFAVVRKMFWRSITGKNRFPKTNPPHTPKLKPTFLSSRFGSKHLRATWLGHACFYVEFPSGLRVIFDPVFEDHCSPFALLGPNRYTPVPCQISELPFMDFIIISHSHYDHLSHPTLLHIKKLFPNAHFLVGLGLEKWVRGIGIGKAREMDWWDDIDITLTPVTAEKQVVTLRRNERSSSLPTSSIGTKDHQPEEGKITARISCLPSQHTSTRTPFDKNTTLWTSWSVSSGGKSVFFAGDTGYRAVPNDHTPHSEDLPVCPHFTQIGNLRGPFDLGLIPIGAYQPREVFSGMHADPEDAVHIFEDTRCGNAIGMHWGTWVLTLEDTDEPPRKLEEAMRKRLGKRDARRFMVCAVGESKEF